MQCFKLFLIWLVALSAGPAFSQPFGPSPYSKVRPELPEPDKGSGYYKRNANRAHKDGDLRKSALYALAWLESEDRDRRKSKAQEYLSEVLPLALSKSEEELEGMHTETAEFKGEPTVNTLRLAKRAYLELIEIQKRHGNLPAEWKAGGAQFPADYPKRLESVSQRLDSAIAQVAEGFYQEAMKLSGQGPSRRAEFLEVARMLKRCRNYLPNYKDAESRYEEVREKATIRLAFSDIRNNSGYQGLFTTKMREMTYEELKKKLEASSLDFFELAQLEHSESPDKFNVRYELEILAIKVKKEKDEPLEKKREKTVGDEKNKRTITGYYVTHSKKAVVQIEAKYRLVDTETNEVLAADALLSGPITAWSHRWYTCKGNCDALKDGERKNTEKYNKDTPYPGDPELVQLAVHDIYLHRALAEKVLPVALAHGR
ncbi:MAG: hypothetical protein KDD10_19255 [Phaeodactylibacter sp.]|nr:hypothetical protein [Phaeodactylibacter sp.]MCB9293416.1 hypothetical protein [Lewinellaceae bacterium]